MTGFVYNHSKIQRHMHAIRSIKNQFLGTIFLCFQIILVALVLELVFWVKKVLLMFKYISNNQTKLWYFNAPLSVLKTIKGERDSLKYLLI